MLAPELPRARLPRLIGSAGNLAARDTTYPLVHLDFPIEPQILTLVAGALASSTQINANTLAALATDFYALFEEYCVVGARFELRFTNGASPTGLYISYIDEKTAAAPTLVQAQSRPHIEGLLSSAGESPSKHCISWKASDLSDLTWSASATAGGSPYIPAWLKVFTSTALGTSAATTGSVLVTGSIAMSFRGYAQ